MGGNTRLAFVALSTLEQSESSFGVVHLFLVLRKDGSTWKVLLLEPNNSLSGIDQLLARLDGVGLSNNSQRGGTNIRLLAPGEGDHVTGISATEIEFAVKGDIGELTGVESQFSNPEQMEWSPTTIHWVGRQDLRMGVASPVCLPLLVSVSSPISVARVEHQQGWHGHAQRVAHNELH